MITNAPLLPELISPLCFSSGRGRDDAPPLTIQMKKPVTVSNREAFARKGATVGKNLQRNPPRLVEPLVRMSDWLVEAE